MTEEEEPLAPFTRPLRWCTVCGVSEVSEEWGAFPCVSNNGKHSPSDMPRTTVTELGPPDDS